MDSSLESDEISGDLSASRHIEIPSSSRSRYVLFGFLIFYNLRIN